MRNVVLRNAACVMMLLSMEYFGVGMGAAAPAAGACDQRCGMYYQRCIDDHIDEPTCYQNWTDCHLDCPPGQPPCDQWCAWGDCVWNEYDQTWHCQTQYCVANC